MHLEMMVVSKQEHAPCNVLLLLQIIFFVPFMFWGIIILSHKICPSLFFVVITRLKIFVSVSVYN